MLTDYQRYKAEVYNWVEGELKVAHHFFDNLEIAVMSVVKFAHHEIKIFDTYRDELVHVIRKEVEELYC